MLSIITTTLFTITIIIIIRRYLKLDKELKSTREDCRIKNYNSSIIKSKLEKLKSEYARLEMGMKKTNAMLQQKSNDLDIIIKQNSKLKKIIEENKPKQEPKKKASPKKGKPSSKKKED